MKKVAIVCNNIRAFRYFISHNPACADNSFEYIQIMNVEQLKGAKWEKAFILVNEINGLFIYRLIQVLQRRCKEITEFYV